MRKAYAKYFAVMFLVSAGMCTCFQNALPQSSRAAERNGKGLEYYNEAFYRQLPQGQNRAAEKYFEMAAEEFKQAIALNPKYAEAHRNLARLHYVRKQYLEAADAYRTVISLNPEDLDSYVQLALIYTHLERYPEAIRQLESARLRTTDREVLSKLDGYIQKIREHE